MRLAGGSGWGKKVGPVMEARNCTGLAGGGGRGPGSCDGE